MNDIVSDFTNCFYNHIRDEQYSCDFKNLILNTIDI